MSETQKQFEAELRKACNDSAATPRSIKLPSKIGIEKLENGLLLRVDAESAGANMQTDSAAVDSWALALRLWLGEERVPRVIVDWAAPANSPNGHYERFLYRVGQFQELFPDWFELVDPQRLEKCKALCESTLVLNVAAKRSRLVESRTTSPEYRFEIELIKSPEFCQQFGLERVDRQFPVGLFAGRVAAGARVFTGGKSAIDIVGVGKDKRFWIFELKAGKNFKVGILSELLLYTNVIREAAGKSPRIQFDTPNQGCKVGPKDVQECSGINAVMLVENLHPLLDHPKLLDTLNAAAQKRWNREPGATPVHFSKVRVWRNPDDQRLVTDFKIAAEANV